MIRFACLSCGMKYQLKEEFAGRQTTCRACRKPLTVPMPVAVAVPVHIDGPTRCLPPQVGGVTLAETQATHARQSEATREFASDGPSRSVREVLSRETESGQRYLVDEELGRGGMGMVIRAVDRDIRREVAVKYLLDPDDPRKKSRFVEEAQVTGQLEHPNIVPVHDLDADTQGRLFFTMKMVRGRSLAQVLEHLRKDPKGAGKEYSLGRLLTALVGVCNGVAYAHSRGVIHRDLKPANVMLGDFGEVYVMDWGLARVLDAEAPKEETPTVAAFSVSPASDGSSSGASPSVTARVVSSRSEEHADLTQEGSVLGTPLYMSPEQAGGHAHAVDQRSDVYSLGALLYEVLTLVPPVSKEGGYVAILHRVIAGEVVHPDRLRRRNVPRELSAVAMKALALRPEDRYPTVEAFRNDMERYLEGRSVSAKEDSPLEQVVKLVKRNRGLSAAMAGAIVVIAVILWVSFHGVTRARERAERALEQLSGEQQARREQGKHSAPSFLKDARASVGRDDLSYALAQVNVALEYDPDLEGALLFKGQVLTGMKRFTEAVDALQAHLKRWPEDRAARELEELCRGAKQDDLGLMRRIAEVLARQDELALAGTMLRAGEDLRTIYRERLEAAWPDKRIVLTLLPNDSYKLELIGSQDNMDLTPLRGMRLSDLNLSGSTALQDLTPLRDMPLTRLTIGKGYALKNLSPLKGMKLTYLNLHQCYALEDIGPLVGMPLTELSLATCGKLRDLSPIRGMPLTKLDLSGLKLIEDISFLRGLPLTVLNLNFLMSVNDLSVLTGMPLIHLSIEHVNADDLTPLKGMPLESLDLLGCKRITDLTPLEGLPLRSVRYSPETVKRGTEVLRKMPHLASINLKPASEYWKEYDATNK